MDVIIKTENLSKHYGEVKAASDINLKIRKGEIYGFIGLNGAGKTTTIRLLLGIIHPTSGSAFINGEKVKTSKNELWKKVGYLV
jgi:ABC-2 type transport system ATP-binding protein